MHSLYRTVATSSGPRRALVVSPDEDELVGRKTLEDLRRGARPVGHDEVVAAVVESPEPIHVVILRARGAEGSGAFRLARDLHDHELEELGYLLAKAQLQTWRELAKHGVIALSRVELRVWELAALRSGTARLMAELEAKRNDSDRARATRARDDRWTLGRALLNFGVGLDTALAELLPMRLEELERERPLDGPAANSPSS